MLPLPLELALLKIALAVTYAIIPAMILLIFRYRIARTVLKILEWMKGLRK